LYAPTVTKAVTADALELPRFLSHRISLTPRTGKSQLQNELAHVVSQWPIRLQSGRRNEQGLCMNNDALAHLIFDPDGVLHPCAYRLSAGEAIFDPPNESAHLCIWATELERMIRGYPNLVLCMVTTPRKLRKLEQVTKQLPLYLQAQLIDVFLANDEESSAERVCSARSYLKTKCWLGLVDSIDCASAADREQMLLASPTHGLSDVVCGRRLAIALERTVPIHDNLFDGFTRNELRQMAQLYETVLLDVHAEGMNTATAQFLSRIPSLLLAGRTHLREYLLDATTNANPASAIGRVAACLFSICDAR
jgi:hypothetical protein